MIKQRIFYTMKKRIKIIHENELADDVFFQTVEIALCEKLEIPSLRSGNITIRDKRNWRINEKQVDYCWLINISRSFVGSCWLFSIKFNGYKFREINNPAELIQGIFTIDHNNEIHEFYLEHRPEGFLDKIKEITNLDLFNTNAGITLDGILYEYLIFSPNLKARFILNNPNAKNWKIWENAVWELGQNLSRKANSIELQEIFA